MRIYETAEEARRAKNRSKDQAGKVEAQPEIGCRHSGETGSRTEYAGLYQAPYPGGHRQERRVTMDIIQIFGIVFLLIMLAGFIVALSEKDDSEDQCRDEQEQSEEELPRVIVTQRVPSVFERRDHRR